MPLMAKQCFFNKTLMYDVIVSITNNLFYKRLLKQDTYNSYTIKSLLISFNSNLSNTCILLLPRSLTYSSF